MNYYYRVKACNSKGCSGYSSYNKGYRKSSGSSSSKPSTPRNIKASDGTYSDKVKITWDSVSKVQNYKVYRCTSKSSSSCKYISANSSTFYRYFYDKSGTVEKKYYYRVTACNSKGCSSYSRYDIGFRKGNNGGGSFSKSSAPTNLSASDGAYPNKIRITWNGVSGAEVYNVQICSNYNKCGPLDAAPNRLWVEHNLVSKYWKKKALYRVQACGRINGKIECGKYSNYDTGYSSGY